MVLMSKVKSEICQIDDTRPIMVLSHITKVVEKAILNKLNELGSKIFNVGGYQTGFKEGKSTSLNLTRVLRSID